MKLLKGAGWLLAGALCLPAQRPAEKEPDIPEKNPFDSAADADAGRKYFLGHCSFCHGPEGEGGRGVNLTAGRYRHGGSDREVFKTISRGVQGTEMPGSRLSPNEVWRLVTYVRRLGAAGAEEKAPGDPAAGRAVYEKAGCAQCHVAEGQGGGNLGPVLSEVGLRRSVKFLRQSLVDPSAFVGDDYRSVAVATRRGEEITGVRLNEDDYSIQIRDTHDNLRSFLKRDVQEVKKQSQSLMPSYRAMLPAGDIDNLVAYLSSLRGKP